MLLLPILQESRRLCVLYVCWFKRLVSFNFKKSSNSSSLRNKVLKVIFCLSWFLFGLCWGRNIVLCWLDLSLGTCLPLLSKKFCGTMYVSIQWEHEIISYLSFIYLQFLEQIMRERTVCRLQIFRLFGVWTPWTHDKRLKLLGWTYVFFLFGILLCNRWFCIMYNMVKAKGII